MATPTILASIPVISARQWSTGLSPRDGGGWKFITQSFNYDNDVPTEWVLIDIEEGAVSLTEGPNRIASNTNFQIASANTLVTTGNQIRAQNGRIFFPEFATPGPGFDDAVNMAYYDPDDEAIHQMPEIVDPTGDRQAIVYQVVFGVDSTLLYCGTQAQIGNQPLIFTVDTETLAVEIIGSVGTASGQPKYAYYLGKDAGPGADFLYVAVGQDTWELISIDLTTNTPTTLYTTTGPGSQFIELEVRAEGFTANIIDNGVQARYWLADGAITAWPGGGAPPGGARTVTPYTNPLVDPPEVDWSRGIEHFLWRPNGSTGDWTEITYEVTYKGPIQLESLTTLPTSALLGNAVQYNGFWTYEPSGAITTWFGAWPLGVSSVAVRSVTDTLTYIAGYPSGALFAYDPTQPWLPDSDGTGNPESLGNYGDDVRYPYFLYYATDNDRLYAAGRRERDADGSGVGYYDAIADTFTTQTNNLSEYIPRGFYVNTAIDRVVFSGELVIGAVAPEAELVIYDRDLVELVRFVVQAGLQNTGLLFPTSDPAIVVGLTNDSPALLYRFNILTGTLLQMESLGAVVVGGSAVRPIDGTIWVDLSQDLVMIDPETLDHTTITDLELSTQVFSWYGSDLYMLVDTELRYLDLLDPEATITPVYTGRVNWVRFYVEYNGGVGDAIAYITSADLIAATAQGPLKALAKVATQGYGQFAAGAQTQAKARALWLSDLTGASPGNLTTARVRLTRRSGLDGMWTVDADVDGDGVPRLIVSHLGGVDVASCYIDVEVPQGIG